MATKKDASGDALCTACLDARVQRRRAEFLQPAARSAYRDPEPLVPTASRATAAPLRGGNSSTPLDTSARRLSSVRIDRVRPAVKSTARKPVDKKRVVVDKKRVVSEILAESHRAPQRPSEAKALQSRTRSLQLAAAEIGLMRAHQLLAQLRTAALAVVERTR
jgi:hypothetical protein